MIRYGEIVTGKVTDMNETDYFVQVEGVTFALAKELADDVYNLGDEVEGIVYETKNRKKVMQVELPFIRPGVYGWGTVVNVRKDLGVFVDIGLLDKEVVISLDDLPELTHLWPKRDDQVYVTYEVDDRNRFWGVLAEPERMQKLMKKAPQTVKNQNVKARVYRVKKAGALCITEEQFSAFLHESETVDEPRIGQLLEARVIGVREDGGINISVRPRAHEALDDDAAMIQALLLKRTTRSLPLHDKSEPDEIKALLGISKAQFKRAVGTLMKQGIIRQEKGKGIFLND